MTFPVMMHAYGGCSRCKCEGALWRLVVTRKRFFFFGPVVTHVRYVCDECDGKA